MGPARTPNRASFNTSGSAPLSPPEGARFSTGQDRYLLDGPTSAPPGAVTVTPGTDDLGTLTTNNSAGTTFYLLAGVHVLGGGSPSEFSQVAPKNNNVYIGAPGAILDGRHINNYAFTGQATGVTIKYLEVINFVCPLEQMTINHDGGEGWTIEYCHFHHNRGCAVGMAGGATYRHNWIHHNEQYAYSSVNDSPMPPNEAVVPQSANVLLQRNEMHHNGDLVDEFLADGTSTGNGRNGTLKFWDTANMIVSFNWFHDSNAVSLWADTNNVGLLAEYNLIEDSWGEGIFYEISYNFMFQYNVFRRVALGKGLNFNYRTDNFPVSAIYISESGSEPRLNAYPYSSQSEIHDNIFDNCWGDVSLWENPDRYCNSRGNTSGKIWRPLGGAANLTGCNNATNRTFTVTLTNGSPDFTITTQDSTYPFVSTDEGATASGTGIPGGTKIVQPTTANGGDSGYLTATTGKLTNNATQSGSVTMTLSGGQIGSAPYYDDCRWKTRLIRVHRNIFRHNASEVLGSNTLQSGVFTGKIALLSTTGTYEAWSPYQGSTVKDAITYNQNNVWDTNTYVGDYSHFMPYDTGGNASFATWRAAPYSQDAGSSHNPTPVNGSANPGIQLPSPPATATATAGNAQAKVEFQPAASVGGDTIIGYTATSSPGGITATARTSPIVVTGLTNNTSYTFTVKARSSIGLSATASSASNSVTPTSGSSFSSTSVPWQPVKPFALKRGSNAEIHFFAPYSNGGASITQYTVTASPGGATQTGSSSPITVTGLAANTYTFTVKATNSAGTGPDSASTNQLSI